MQTVITSVLIPALVSLSVLASYLLLKDSADLTISDGWLGFLGALVGAGLAVFGAVHVERSKQKGAKAESLSLLANALETLGRLLSDLRIIIRDLVDNERLFKAKGEERDLLGLRHNSALARINEATFSAIADQVDFIEYFTDKQPIGSSTLWSELRRIDRAHSYWRELIDEPDSIRRHSFDEAYAEGEKIEQMCRAMAIPVDLALRELNRELKDQRTYTNLYWKQLEPSHDERARLLATLPKQMIYHTRSIRRG